jgi:ketosteroid isomerase-like protein
MQYPQRGKTFVRLAPLCFLLLFAAPLTARAQVTDSTKLPAALRSARDSLNKALTSLDAPASSRFFADTALLNFGGEIVRGRAGVDAWLAGQFQGISAVRFQSAGFNITDTQVTERAGYTVTIRDGGGEQSGTNESIWAKQKDGSWKVVRLTIT